MATSRNCNNTDVPWRYSVLCVCVPTGLWWCPSPRSSPRTSFWCRLGLMPQRATPLLWEGTRSPPNVSQFSTTDCTVCPSVFTSWSRFQQRGANKNFTLWSCGYLEILIDYYSSCQAWTKEKELFFYRTSLHPWCNHNYSKLLVGTLLWEDPQGKNIRFS